MPLEEVAEYAVRFFGRMFIEVVFEVVCYRVGLFTLRLCSGGRYPPRVLSERHTQIAQVLGVFVLLAAGVLGWHFWPFAAGSS
jgi:hypothetical protein